MLADHQLCGVKANHFKHHDLAAKKNIFFVYSVFFIDLSKNKLKDNILCDCWHSKGRKPSPVQT